MGPKRGPLIFLAILFALLLPSLVQIAWPFLTSFLLASILAIVLNPANKRLCRRLRRPALATFLTTIATVLLLGGIFGLAGFALTRELTATYDALSRRSLEQGGWPELVTHTTDRLVDALATRLSLDKEAIRGEFVDGMKAVTGYVLNNIGKAAGGVTDVLISSLFTTIFLYFLLRHGKEWLDYVASIIPLDRRVTRSLVQTVHHSVVANVNGVIAVALCQGLLLSIGFWAVGVRSAGLWGAIGGLASIVPVVGSPLVWVPVVVAFVLLGSYGKALLLGLWGALIVGSVDNVLRPLVVGAGEKQHPVLIAFAAIGGTYAFGVLGILLGPLVVSLVAALLKEIQELAPQVSAGAPTVVLETSYDSQGSSGIDPEPK